MAGGASAAGTPPSSAAPLVSVTASSFGAAPSDLTAVGGLPRKLRCAARSKRAAAAALAIEEGTWNAKTIGRGIALVLTAAPHSQEYEQNSGIRTRFTPYASSEAFGANADKTRIKYVFGLGFSGGSQLLSGRYPYRAKIFAEKKDGNGTRHRSETLVELESQGVRLGLEDSYAAYAIGPLWPPHTP